MEKFIQDMFAKGMTSDEIAKAMTEALNAAEAEREKANFRDYLAAGPSDALINDVAANTYTVKDALVLYIMALGREDPAVFDHITEKDLDMYAKLVDSLKDIASGFKTTIYSEPKVTIKEGKNPSISFKPLKDDRDIITEFLKSL